MMFLAIITSKVRKELKSIGFDRYQGLEFTKSKGGIYFYKLIKDGKDYVVRFYEDGTAAEIADNHKKLENIGIRVIEIITYSKFIVVTKDFEENRDCYRLNKTDLLDENIVKKLACFCKSLCCCGEGVFCDLNKNFSIGTIGVISKNMNIKNSKVLNYILEHFDNILNKLNKLDKSVVLLGMSRENLFFDEDQNLIFLDVVGEVCEGCRYMAVELFLNMLEENMKNVFLSEVGSVKEEEILFAELMWCIFGLNRFCNSGKVNDFAVHCLEKINSNDMLDAVMNIVEWH